MKHPDTHFENYLHNEKNEPLHPSLHKLYDSFPNDIKQLKNILFYGPKGVGKYTQMLRSIVKYSPSNLKYDKKLVHDSAKMSYIMRISDIHFEIDMSLLGCNSKNLWNDIYKQIVEVIISRPNKSGIIVCKCFQDIHSELLDCFYCYMKSHCDNVVDIKFILITEEISFIPDCIVDTCKIIRIPRPSRRQYNKCLKNKLPKEFPLNKVTNMKTNYNTSTSTLICCDGLCDEILNMIINPDSLSYSEMRDKLYDLLIYNMDVAECIWYILCFVINGNYVKANDVQIVMLNTYICVHYYNNNYRPIYHLERFVFYLINTIHGYSLGM
jgi:hypothetical protein